MLRLFVFKIIDVLKIEGGCNVQFVLNFDSFEYVVIEVNLRVSCLFVLVLKVIGYLIVRIAVKIVFGYIFDEIENVIIKMIYVSFEFVFDYVVLKILCWLFDKFIYVNRKFGIQMKVIGEVMVIGRMFEESFLKGIRFFDIGLDYLDFLELKSLDNESFL